MTPRCLSVFLLSGRCTILALSLSWRSQLWRKYAPAASAASVSRPFVFRRQREKYRVKQDLISLNYDRWLQEVDSRLRLRFSASRATSSGRFAGVGISAERVCGEIRKADVWYVRGNLSSLIRTWKRNTQCFINSNYRSEKGSPESGKGQEDVELNLSRSRRSEWSLTEVKNLNPQRLLTEDHAWRSVPRILHSNVLSLCLWRAILPE